MSKQIAEVNDENFQQAVLHSDRTVMGRNGAVPVALWRRQSKRWRAIGRSALASAS